MYAKGQRPGRSSGQASARCWLAMLPVFCAAYDCIGMIAMIATAMLYERRCVWKIVELFESIWQYSHIVHRLRLFPRSLRNVHPKWSNMIQPYVVYWYRHQLHPSPGSVLGEGTAENPADKFTPGAPQGILQGRAEMLETVEKSIIWN